MMKSIIKNVTMSVLILLFISCSEMGSANLEKAISQVQDNQKIMLQKIENLEKGQRSLKQNLTQAPNNQKNKKDNRPQADPNKVYDIAIGNSVVKGNKDAKVTIIEWMDFQ